MELRADDADAASPSPPARWVIFVCAEERFGIPLSAVREIVPPRPFTRLPGASRAVCGLIGVRGRVVTVVDAGTALGLGPAVLPADHRLLLLEQEGRNLALAVEEVIAIATAWVDPMPGVPEGRLAKAVLGRGRTDEASFVALQPWPLIEHLLN